MTATSATAPTTAVSSDIPRGREAVLDAVRELRPRLAELAVVNDQRAELPAESLALLHAAGALTATIAPRHGGAGLGHVGVHELLVEIGGSDPAAALIVAMTLALHQREAAEPSLDAGFYAELVAESFARPTLVNALQVEPALGTPSRGGVPATRAVRTAAGWAVTGHKIYSTGAPGLRWMFVLAATDEPEPRVGTFVVDGGGPGVEVRPTWSALGMRATVSHDVLLEAAPVPDTLVTGLRPAGRHGGGPPGAGPGTAVPSIYLGVAHAARDWFVAFLRERVPANLGHPLIELPRFEAALGEIELDLLGAGELLRAVARRADAGEAVPRDLAWAAKTHATRAAVRSVETTIALIGNPGLSTQNPLARHLRDVLSARAHFPQEDTVLTALGRTAAARSTAASTTTTRTTAPHPGDQEGRL